MRTPLPQSQALEAEQQRGRALQRAAQTESILSTLQKEMLDLTADGLRVREELDSVREELVASRARVAQLDDELRQKEDERARERHEVQASFVLGESRTLSSRTRRRVIKEDVQGVREEGKEEEGERV